MAYPNSAVLKLAPSPDELHERHIDSLLERWNQGEPLWPEIVAAINARSPQQVERMERERGLV